LAFGLVAALQRASPRLVAHALFACRVETRLDACPPTFRGAISTSFPAASVGPANTGKSSIDPSRQPVKWAKHTRLPQS
jgi:hypothetical protein